MGGTHFYRDAAGIEGHTVSQIDHKRDRLIETYRKKAKHYDITCRLYPVPATPNGHNASGPYRRSAFVRVTA